MSEQKQQLPSIASIPEMKKRIMGSSPSSSPSSSSFTDVSYSVHHDGTVAVIQLNRPKRKNAFYTAMVSLSFLRPFFPPLLFFLVTFPHILLSLPFFS
jgi:hypothetical protein